MLLWLWHFWRGFVTVDITGFSVERFINMAAYRGVYVWDVVRTPEGVRLNVSVKGFRLLKGCAKKTKCQMRIVRKQGAPFIIHRYRKRKILLAGIIFFVAALYALSSFVWRIDIRGNERLAREDIAVFLERRGLKTGAFKFALDHKGLQQALMEAFPDISWVDIHTKGTRTTVLLAEIIPKQPIIDKETPCDIVATKDGLISGIVTGAGKPLVKKNDVVRQGELLVSGTLESPPDSEAPGVFYVHAYAEVWAKAYTQLHFSIPLEYIEKAYTGRTQTRYEAALLFAGGRRVKLTPSSIPYENYDKMTYHRQPGVSGDYPLPVVFIATEYVEFIPQTRTRSVAEAMELAERMVTGRILRELDINADIVDKRIDMEEKPGHLLVTAWITTNERIDKAVPIAHDAPIDKAAPVAYDAPIDKAAPIDKTVPIGTN